jgi:serine/threonine protein kinase
MIDEKGYPVLIDFGFAKQVVDKTYTLCGTPGYVAPEVVTRRGHNCSADDWSLGILIYELISGGTPFYYDGMSQRALFESIVKDEPKPPPGASDVAVDLIMKLLVKDPIYRLGSLARGVRDILEHPFFGSYELKAMRRKEHKAPWVPVLHDRLDTSNFEDWSHLEDKTSHAYEKLSASDAALFHSF